LKNGSVQNSQLSLDLYPSKPGDDHTFHFGIWMWLVLEVNAVLKQKGHKNVEKLQACQNLWLKANLVYIKTWEIELLDNMNETLKMSLQDAMMTLHHPTNKYSTL